MSLEASRLPDSSTYGETSRSGSRAKRNDNGPIVFFSGAPFCTDLFGDREGLQTPLHITGVGKDGYSNHTQDALGCHIERPSLVRTTSGSIIPRRPLEDIQLTDEATYTPSDTPSSEAKNFFAEEQPMSPFASSSLPELNACGLDNIRPMDHFVVKVKTRRTNAKHPRFRTLKSSPSEKIHKITHRILQSSSGLFACDDEFMSDDLTGNSAALSAAPAGPSEFMREAPVEAQILATKYVELPPSQLPAAGFYIGDTSSELELSSIASNDSLVNVDHLRFCEIEFPGYAASTDESPPPPPFLLGTQVDSQQRSMEEDSFEEDVVMDGGSNSSIDMLAQARQLDPEFIKLMEEEFEMGVDEQKREAANAIIKISAATVGAHEYAE